MFVTQKDIAQRLGLSQTVVARALQGSPRVAEKTRLQVETMAQELNYSPDSNPGARALAARRHGGRVRTGTIAVLFESQFNGRPLRSLPYFAPFFDAVEEECLRQDLDAVFMPVRNQKVQRVLREGLADGVLLLGYDDRHLMLDQIRVPYVMVDASLKGVHSIRAAGGVGIASLVTHLGGLGHRRIAYLGHPVDGIVSRERLEGYRAGLTGLGIVPQDSWEATTVYCQTSESVEEALRALWQRNPQGFTAIVCHNDAMAMHVIGLLESWGLSVPRMVSVTGFDDISLESGFSPALTSVFSDRAAMARRGLHFLQELIDKAPGGASSCSEEIFPVEIRVRQSTAPAQDAATPRTPRAVLDP